MPSIDRRALIAVFERLDDALDRPQTICLIGAAAVLSLGHVARQTGDIDVWRPASSINDRALARAGKLAGIAIDDRSDLPDGIYLQVIRPGVVQLPPFVNGVWATGEPSVTVWQGDKLTVETAPAAVIAATKLVRAEDRELWTLAVDTLSQLLDDDLVLARALRTRDYRRLYAAATVARRSLDETMAITDPYLYQRLSQAIVLMNLKGYGGLDIDKLRRLVEEGSPPEAMPAP